MVILTYSGVFIVNFEHISHLPRREKCQNTCFILEKRKKIKFSRLQIEVLFLPNISPPVYKHGAYIQEDLYRPVKFSLCPYIRPKRITGILRYLY